MAVKFWMNMAFCELEQWPEISRIAEQLGFYGVTLPEHQFFPETLQSAYPYSSDHHPQFSEQDDWPDIWPMAGAIAAVTERLQILTSIHVLPLQHPIAVAKSTATLAALSHNRFNLGVGAGWMAEEYDAYGIDFGSRGRRMNEAVEVLLRLWSGEMVEFHGEFFDFNRVRTRPSPSEAIPLWFGGKSNAALRRAAKLGSGWIAGGEPPNEVINTLTQLQTLRKKAGLTNHPFEAIALHSVGLNHNFEEVEKMTEAGLTGIVHLPFRFGMDQPLSTIREKTNYLERFSQSVISRFS